MAVEYFGGGLSIINCVKTADLAAESGMTIPSEPEVFTKATSAISGPNDDIHVIAIS